MQLHDICVQLLTENENPLPEYGFVKHSKSNQASCHVPSVTGVSFYIRVEALAKDESLAKVPWNKLSVGVYVDKNPDEDVSKDAGCLFSRAGQTEYSFMGREYRREDGKNSLQKWRFVENGLESYFEAVLSLDTPKDSKTTSTGKITIMICQVEDISYSCFPDFCPDKINEKKNMINPGLDHSIG